MSQQLIECLRTQGVELNQTHPLTDTPSLNYISDLTHYGLLKICGPDAATFLQGQVSCDVTQLTPEHSAIGCYCNNQGRMIANFRIVRIGEEYLLFMPSAMLQVMKHSLEKYTVFSKVTVCLAAHYELFAFGGPNSMNILDLHGTIENDTVVHQQDLIFVQFPGPHPRFACFGLFNATETFCQTHCQQLTLLSDDTWHYTDIITGTPTIYPVTQEKFLPHRVNFHLLGGLDFEKGCYLGQEVIARLHYRGTLKHHMYLYEVSITEHLQPGLAVVELENGKTVGYIVDTIESDPKQWLALIVMQQAWQGIEEASINGHVHLKQLALPYSIEPTSAAVSK